MKKSRYLPDSDVAETILTIMWLVLMMVYNSKPQEMPLKWMSICVVISIYFAIPVMMEFITLVRRKFSWQIIWLALLLLAVIAFFIVFCVRAINLVL